MRIIEDKDGKRVVVIEDVKFKGKRAVDWGDVEQYLKRYVGEFYTVADTKDVVYVGTDFPDEYAHSNYTNYLRGTNAKAKANAAQGLPELLEIASGKKFENNRKEKHNKDAKHGWYSYESRFAMPVYNDSGELERYNVFRVYLLVRHAKDQKLYLYDIMNIKKETSNLFQPNDLTQ